MAPDAILLSTQHMTIGLVSLSQIIKKRVILFGLSGRVITSM